SGDESNPRELSQGEWRPFGFSGSGSAEAPLVYAGSGIANSGGHQEEIPDVEGRVMVVESGTPEMEEGSLYLDPHFKGSAAQGRGASALLILLEEGEALPELSTEDKPFLRIPVVAVSGGAAEAVRAAAQGGSSFARVEAQVEPALSDARNVVAVHPGSDPALAREVVILGAHYDHLGYGGAGSLAPGVMDIHNGADDNASGTAALLEAARLLSETETARPVLFIAFSGEERGLLGSAHFVAQPTIPLESAVAMVNMDMVGRVRDNTTTVFGMATAPEWEALLAAVNESQPEPFNLTLMPDGYGPSDHSSFYGAGIPVLHFFTNTHSEYHRPEDDWQTLNGEGLDRLASLVSDLTRGLAGVGDDVSPATLTLVQSAPPEASEEGGRGYGPYFGSVPDMGYQGFGVRLTGVREGGPAANAGLQAGDVIVAFGGTEVGDLYQYTYALREMAPGDVVDVVVERDGRRVTLQAVLGERR
ncbi:MAG: M28 family peptidase, partial [Gemmatimonadales bacterium]